MTAEVRWFFEDEAPEPICRWFLTHADEPQQRVDLYLPLFETDALGTKLREGGTHLELKLRTEQLGPWDLFAGVVGNVERWQKWSMPLVACDGAALGEGLSCIEVEKRRRMVTYGLAPDGTAFPAGDDAAASGCRVELTQVRAAGREWSTLGFEAFGEEPTLLQALTAAAHAAFGEMELEWKLGVESSCGYPGWLQALTRRG